jgi:general secretion pathway protein N
MTRRRLALYAVVASLSYAVALIAMLPASWFSHVIERVSRQKLELRAPTGSAWSGSGRLYGRQRSGSLVDLGAVRWASSPTGLLQAKLVAEVTLNDGPKPIRIEWSPGSVAVRDLEMQFPGKLLAALAAPLEIFGPEGSVSIRAENFRVEGDTVLGLASVEWREVRLARANGIELGSHVARLRGAGSRVDIELGTLEGPLRLSGAGTWSARAGLVLSGIAEPREDRAATLGPFLKGICPEYRESRCLFHLNY